MRTAQERRKSRQTAQVRYTFTDNGAFQPVCSLVPRRNAMRTTMKTAMKTKANRAGGLSCALAAVLLSMSAFGQAPIVIEGGTLIDGNGGAPVPDSVVIIQGNKITAVSRKGQASYPPGAQVIKADGKFVLPGLIDGQVSYNWPFGEACSSTASHRLSISVMVEK